MTKTSEQINNWDEFSFNGITDLRIVTRSEAQQIILDSEINSLLVSLKSKDNQYWDKQVNDFINE